MSENLVIGSYTIFEPLGSGGMGIVYRARHIDSERPVALKTVKVRTAPWLASIRREIHALTKIKHPGVVRIVDHGVHDGSPWYAMDLLEGESLRNFGQRIWSPYQHPSTPPSSTVPVSDTVAVSNGSSEFREPQRVPPSSEHDGLLPGLPPAAAGHLQVVLRFFVRICATLAYLHGEGYVNCDLKPENILLVNDEPIIIDFGLSSQDPGGSSREALEAQRGMSGTVPYMSPEQFRGDLLDARSDLYSVGCMLYELLVGAPPFTGNARAMMSGHLTRLPHRLSSLVAQLPKRIEVLVLKLLEKNLVDRYGFADEVASGLGGAAGITRFQHWPQPRPYLYRARLVGREAPIAQLIALRDAAAQGSGALVLIGGESGVGKTRLAIEITRLPKGARLQVVASESPALSTEAAPIAPAPLHALRPLLQAIADRCQEGGPAVTERLLGHRSGVLSRYEPALAHVPGAPASEDLSLLPEAARQRLFTYLGEVVAAFALEQPLLWVLDDIGWADELSLSFFASLTPEYLATHPMLIVGTFRAEEPSEGIDALLRATHVTHVPLKRLDRAGVQSMVEDMLALGSAPAPFVDFVHEQGEGNPFFVAEYLRAAVTERVLYRDQSRSWRLPQPTADGESFSALSLPTSLREVVERRLSTLSPDARDLLRAAAVVGRDSDNELLSAVMPLDDDASVAATDELIRRQVLEPAKPNGLRFAHDKLREVAYAQAPIEQRRLLHARAARALEATLDPGAADRLWATLGHHYSAALLLEPAAKYLQLAAEHARSTYANADAIRLYTEAIHQVRELLKAEGSWSSWHATLLSLYEAVADVSSLAGRRSEARSFYDSALEHLGDRDRAGTARLFRKLGKTWEVQHKHEEAQRFYDLALQALGDASPETLAEWIETNIDQIWLYYWQANVSQMDRIISKIQAEVAASGSPRQRVRFFHSLSLRNLRRDRFAVVEETLQFARAAVHACEEDTRSAELPMVAFNYGFNLLFHGSLEPAQRELGRALALARRTGAPALESRCLCYLALAARMSGRADEVEVHNKRAFEVSTAAGLREYIAAALANRGWLSLNRGDLGLARDTCQEALAMWASLPLVFPFQWAASLPLMRISLIERESARAVECAGRLIAPTQHCLPGAATDALSRAVRAWAAGEAAEAELALGHAISWLEQSKFQ